MAGLPACSAWVAVGPPLFCSGPSWGSARIGAVPTTVQRVSSKNFITLGPLAWSEPAHSSKTKTRSFPARMVFWNVKVPPCRLNTPPPTPPTFVMLALLPVIVLLNTLVVAVDPFDDPASVCVCSVAAHRAVGHRQRLCVPHAAAAAIRAISGEVDDDAVATDRAAADRRRPEIEDAPAATPAAAGRVVESEGVVLHGAVDQCQGTAVPDSPAAAPVTASEGAPGALGVDVVFGHHAVAQCERTEILNGTRVIEHVSASDRYAADGDVDAVVDREDPVLYDAAVAVNDGGARSGALDAHAGGDVQIASRFVRAKVVARNFQGGRSWRQHNGCPTAWQMVGLHDRRPQSTDAVARRRLAHPVFQGCAGHHVGGAVHGKGDRLDCPGPARHTPGNEGNDAPQAVGNLAGTNIRRPSVRAKGRLIASQGTLSRSGLSGGFRPRRCFHQAGLHACRRDTEQSRRDRRRVLTENGDNPYYRWFGGIVPAQGSAVRVSPR